MRFLFGGIAIFLVIAFFVGRIFSTRRTPMRKVLAKGFYYTTIGTLVLAVLFGIGALIYFAFSGNGMRDTGPFQGMNETEKSVYIDSLLSNPPDPSIAQLETWFIKFRFNSGALPCYESIHAFDITSLEQIVHLEKVNTKSSDRVYEINLLGEFKTDRPEVGFHVKGLFVVQYTFSKGERDVTPGWNFSKVSVYSCEVLSHHADKKEKSREDLYPDLKRTAE